mmetsp:Transcript_3659/g.9516  ORF Transcript_3659/g.9516 Transcript_3659/m.9516 type:complete len:103 (+) Transcript_3659:275-583(+)
MRAVSTEGILGQWRGQRPCLMKGSEKSILMHPTGEVIEALRVYFAWVKVGEGNRSIEAGDVGHERGTVFGVAAGRYMGGGCGGEVAGGVGEKAPSSHVFLGL